jgi:hydroxymethylpyrimidine/phosphomethylpyrimidine kinase
VDRIRPTGASIAVVSLFSGYPVQDRPPPIVLTIGGSDSSAGAGVQADARAIHTLDGYACTAITAITAQNTRGVQRWRAVPGPLVAAQIRSVTSDLPVGAIKTGLLPGAAVIRAVARTLPPHVPLVLDPVIASSSGTVFLSPPALRVLARELLPRATLLTPNWPEAAALTGRAITSFADADKAAQALLASGCRAVLLKGGHAPGRRCRDLLVTAEGVIRVFEHPRIETLNTHGTGCTLAAAIATGLASGQRLRDAVERAIALLGDALDHGRTVRWGTGAGPALS